MAVLAGADWRWMGAAVLAAGGAILAGAWRWQWCLRAFGIDQKLGPVLHMSLAGHAAGFTGLGAAGTDITRGALLKRRTEASFTDVAGSLIMDHASALPALMVVAFIVLRLLGRLPGGVDASVVAGTGLALFFLTGYIARRFYPAWHERVLAHVRRSSCRKGAGMAVLISLLVMAFQCGIFVCTARALNVHAPTLGVAGTAAAADAVAALPVSVAGLGVREQAFVLMLGRWFHVPPDQAAALSVAGWAALALWALAGAACLFSSPARRGIL